MKKFALAVCLMTISATTLAAGLSCDELKEKITQKLDGKNIKNYTLDIVAKDTETTDRVVGECAGGAKKIIYKRGAAAAVKKE